MSTLIRWSMHPEKLPRVTEDDAEELRTFIKEYIQRSGRDGVVVGLSGGIDSAVVTKLAADALGADKVHCIYLPAATSPAADRENTENLCRTWGLGYECIDIQPAVDAFKTMLHSDLSPVDSGNIAARCRMTVLYSRAKTMNRVVLGTSNQSELLMGYFTKFGDGACDLVPLANMYKTNVRQLARLLGLPADIISRPPSAGFWEGQTDEDEMGISYDLLDQVLWGIEQEDTDPEIANRTGVSLEKVKAIRQRVGDMVHKRVLATRPGNLL